MGLWDTVKNVGGSTIKQAAPIGIALLKDEITNGRNSEPETRPDTRSQPVSSTQQFEPKETKAFSIPKPALIGGGIAAVSLIVFMAFKRK